MRKNNRGKVSMEKGAMGRKEIETYKIKDIGGMRWEGRRRRKEGEKEGEKRRRKKDKLSFFPFYHSSI